MVRFPGTVLILLLGSPHPVSGQTADGKTLAGLWQLEKGTVKAEGPRTVMIRPDSSASWGKETVRWRLVPANGEIMIALGGEWETYKLRVKQDRLELWGGDLTEKITLKRVGMWTARPPNVPIPPDPDTIP